jgi:YidC/Oxa1 family membrane protein insertase
LLQPPLRQDLAPRVYRRKSLVEKRVVLFMVLSAGIMLSYVAFQAAFGPKKAPLPLAKKADDGKKKGTEKPKPEKEKVPVAAEKPEKPAPTEVAATKAKQQWLTLGSVDPESPYRLLATFNSRGGTVERIELASPRYRNLNDRSGYLGHLALQTVKGKGAEVRVVGAGTPAAQAVAQKDSKIVGLAAGDVIEAFNGTAVKTKEDLLDALHETKHGDSATIDVMRGSQKLVFDVNLGRRPLEVIHPETEDYEEGDPTATPHPLSCLLTLTGRRNANTTFTPAPNDPLRTNQWDGKVVTRGKDQAVEFTYRLSDAEAKELGLDAPVEVVRRFSLAKLTEEEQSADDAMGYHLECELEIYNLSDQPQQIAYQMDGPNGLPLEGWWYTNKIGPNWGAYGARDIVYRPAGWSNRVHSCASIYKYASKNPKKPSEPLLGGDETTNLDYIGVDAQYFSAVLQPALEPKGHGSSFRSAVAMPVYGIASVPKVEMKRTNVSFRMLSDLKSLPPAAADGERGEKPGYHQSMRLFAGPKVPAILAKYDLDEVLYYGWFRAVSIPLAALLHFLKHNILFNYGLAIIALTVIVRGCMVPFSLKAAKNAKMMQDLQPEMKRIAEKYKNDLQKRSEAQNELFKKHKYNPLSGCLPMFMQLPIFLGLYRALSTDIELRQAALVPGLEWASNLAGPDMLWYWKGVLPNFLAGEASGWLGPYLNVLPLVSVCFLLVHQKLFTPPATDEQTKMTQDMMKYMTVFMGVMFFKVPAGLCIYFITSSLWSICERVWLPKSKPALASAGGGDLSAETKSPPSSAKPGNNNGADDRSKRQKQKRR